MKEGNLFTGLTGLLYSGILINQYLGKTSTTKRVQLECHGLEQSEISFREIVFNYVCFKLQAHS